MKLEIKVPSVGESVTQADIETWEKSDGDFVQKGETLVVLGTDKASMEVPAEMDGVLNLIKQNGETVSVGEVIATIDTDEKAIAKAQSASQVQKTQKDTKTSQSLERMDHSQQESKHPPEMKLSPSVRHLAGEHNIDPKNVTTTGKNGRLTKKDILEALAHPESSKETEVLQTEVLQTKVLQTEVLQTVTSVKKGQQREAMSRLRKRTAERLVQSQQATATLSTFNEVDMSRIMELRKNYQDTFVKRYGIKLGFMSFFVKAIVSALKQYPKMNAFIDGTDIIYNNSYNIGVAVGTERGLVVPVIFNSEDLSLAAIEKQILIYKEKAISKKLTPDDLLGGTFTISNGGVFGSLLSTPILNPPQSGILGMHKIEQRPVVIDNKIEIRPLMYVALSYDHRIVDGRESVGFLVKVKEGLEEPARLLIDI